MKSKIDIAYDCLGFREQCRQAIGSLFLTINEYDDEDDPSFENRETMSSQDEESKIAILFLQHMTNLAPSPEVRELLFSLIDDIAEESLPAFEFADCPLLGNRQFDFDYDSGQISIDFCKHKSFWKKIRMWGKEVIEWINDAVKLLKGINDAREQYERWKKESNQNNCSYEEFRKHYNYAKKVFEKD